MIKKNKLIIAIISIFFVFGVSSHANEIDPMGSIQKITSKISNATGKMLSLSGYFNAHYMLHNGATKLVGKNINKPLWQIREGSIFADLSLTENLLLSTELEVSYDFSSKSTSGRSDRLEALFNYFYFDFDLSSQFDWETDKYGIFSLRGGRILVPFLSYNENKPNFRQNLMSQPFTAWQLAPVNNVAASFKQFGWTDIGISGNWGRAFNPGILDIKLSIINGLGSQNPTVLDSNTVTLNPPGAVKPTVRPRDGLVNARSNWDSFDDNNDNKAVVTKVSFASSSYPIDFGFSWYNGEWDNAGSQNLNMYGFHLNYLEKDWSIKGEYVKADVEQTGGVNIVTVPGPAPINTSTSDYDMHAWYIEGSYIPYRYGNNNNYYLKLVARYDDVDTNDKAIFTPFDRSRITLGTEWQFLRNTRLRYEWQKSSIDSFGNAPAPFIAAGGKKNIFMNMVSIIAYF